MVQQFRTRVICYEEDNRNLRLQLMQGKKSMNVRKCSASDGNQQEYRLWRANESNIAVLDKDDKQRDNVSQHTIEEKEDNEINLTQVDLTFPEITKLTSKSGVTKDVLVVGMIYNRELLDTIFVTKRNRTMAVVH